MEEETPPTKHWATEGDDVVINIAAAASLEWPTADADMTGRQARKLRKGTPLTYLRFPRQAEPDLSTFILNLARAVRNLKWTSLLRRLSEQRENAPPREKRIRNLSRPIERMTLRFRTTLNG